jgi:uncharacterized membrane protein
MSELSNTFAPMDTSSIYGNIFWFGVLASVSGLGLSGYWTFDKSKTTTEINNQVRIVDEDSYLMIAGIVLTFLGSLFCLGSVYYSHEGRQNYTDKKHSTSSLLFLHFQHILTFSALLGLLIIFANFSQAPTQNIPKVYVQEIFIFTLITFIIITISGLITFFKRDTKQEKMENFKEKLLKGHQHLFSGLVLLTTVIITGTYLNSGNIPSGTSIALSVTSGITLLWTAGVFFRTYSNHTDIYKTDLYQT